jgi:3-oxoacyl-[acyl-carrier-protein] synthase III
VRIATYFPSGILDNEELCRRFPEWSPGKIEKKLGIRSRHQAVSDETAADMAFAAADALLTDEDRRSIDFVLFCTQSPDYYMPTSACILQERLGLPTTVGAIDYNLGCSGFIYGLAITKGLLASGVASKVLLLTAETYSKHIHPRDKGNLSIFGDAAAATILDLDDLPRLHEFALGTDGKGAENLIVRNGGLRSRFNPEAADWTDENDSLRNDNALYMNGPEIFNFTIATIPPLLEQVLARNNLTLADLDYVIFHQANQYMLQYLRDLLGIPGEKFYIGMLDCGNTVCATIPIALRDCLDRGLVTPGDKVLVAGFGVGYSYGATIITI